MLLVVILWLFVGAGIAKVFRIVQSGIFSGVRVARVALTRLGAAALRTVFRWLIVGPVFILSGSVVIFFRGVHHVDIAGGRGRPAAGDRGSNIDVNRGSMITHKYRGSQQFSRVDYSTQIYWFDTRGAKKYSQVLAVELSIQPHLDNLISAAKYLVAK